MVTALDLLSEELQEKRLYFDISGVDNTIGGFLPRGIWEIFGAAGSGKSQMCMHLSLQVQRPKEGKGLSGNAAYLCCGEGKFPIKRLNQMAIAFGALHGISAEDLLRNIHIENCHSTENIKESLFERVPKMCQNNNVRLLIIDSLAGIIRFEFSNSDRSEMTERSATLFQVAKHLKWLADTFQLIVIVVNQVTSWGPNAAIGSDSRNSNVSPSLGLGWSHCINSRLRLSRSLSSFTSFLGSNSQNYIKSDENKRLFKRILSLEISPFRPNRSCRFVIQDGGIADDLDPIIT